MISSGSVVQNIVVARPLGAVYPLVADAAQAVRSAPPVVHVRYVEHGDGGDLIERWTVEDGAIRSWRAARWLDPAAGTVRFEQRPPQPPVLELGGRWRMTALAAEETRVELRHEWRVTGDGAPVEARLRRGTGMQLEAVKRLAEEDGWDLVHEESVLLHRDARDVEAFLSDARAWPGNVAGRAGVRAVSGDPGRQVVEVRTEDAGTLRRAHVWIPGTGLVWKDLGPLPGGCRMSWGNLTVRPVTGGTLVTSRHAARLAPGSTAPPPVPAPIPPLGALEEPAR
ncbi:aromatase/cyclase [Actinomadura formosensis]|uniref:aromatase/cyclase n=1 Tax=Actinomadura formosensis TaxID=60706 RepID=UPI003D9266AA